MMKKYIQIFIALLVTLSSICYADMVPGQYDYSVFGIIELKIGFWPALICCFLFVIVLTGISIMMARKALDVKNYPKNKSKFMIVTAVIVVLAGMTIYSAWKEANYSKTVSHIATPVEWE